MSEEHTTLEKIRADFEKQVESLLKTTLAEDVHLEDHGVFPEVFEMHFDRLGQLLTLARNLDIEDNMWDDLNLISAVVEEGYTEPKLVPVLRQEADYIWVGFELPPMMVADSAQNTEYLSVATIPIYPGEAIPFEGQNVLLMTTHESGEVVFGSYDALSECVVFIWGEGVIEQLNAQFPSDAILN